MLAGRKPPYKGLGKATGFSAQRHTLGRQRRKMMRNDEITGSNHTEGCRTPLHVGLDVEIRHAERIFHDEFAPRFHHIAHQRAEDQSGIFNIADLDLQQGAAGRI